jgi:S-formylglutathione hydrolase
MSITTLTDTLVYGGHLLRQQHESSTCNCSMTYAIFLPPQASEQDVPVLYWLSGLTCNDENFSQKAGAFDMAARLGLALVMPDTSPRGCSVEGEDERYDLGTGAGFYINATESGWSEHYRMYDYITQELPALLAQHHPLTDQASIAGHSMGGHGALICALKNPGHYRSVSAFAPISSPSQCSWGTQAFTTYLGSNPTLWQAWDANFLVQINCAAGIQPQPMLIDQGGADPFLQEQLQPHLFAATCRAVDYPLDYRLRPGYDHSYYYIASFIDEHLLYHGQALGLEE